MTVEKKRASSSFFLPKFKHLRWTWRRWLLLGLAVLPFVDSIIVPISHWNGRQEENMLFMILGFRAAASAEPPLAVSVLGACLVCLVAAMARGFIAEASLLWTPILLALTLFFLLTWRWGRKDAPPSSTDK